MTTPGGKCMPLVGVLPIPSIAKGADLLHQIIETAKGKKTLPPIYYSTTHFFVFIKEKWKKVMASFLTGFITSITFIM